MSLRSPLVSLSATLGALALTPSPLLSPSHQAAGPTRSVLSRPSLPPSLGKLSFPAFYRSCNPTPRSFSLSVRYRYWQRPHPCVPRQPMTKQNKPTPLPPHPFPPPPQPPPQTHRGTQPCAHACCRSRSRPVPQKSKRGLGYHERRQQRRCLQMCLSALRCAFTSAREGLWGEGKTTRKREREQENESERRDQRKELCFTSHCFTSVQVRVCVCACV